ncbi:DEAD-domain-containing protein [Vararia minispora EC-137]|uniref:DEAD-domain-containing protein n=1 Tax=Vararia minispora EC-137 TaxID=1314806 RepID=A0ACB8QQE0_9AGAM|nr:DEAD-domain-containing protein [Vararia minispora EC-137]
MAPDKHDSFASFGNVLSPLLLKALADLGFARPTPVQQKGIPLALENRDVLARARTGSGKTAAYSIPLVQKILNVKSALEHTDDRRQCTRALVLVPTKELAEQVSTHIKCLVKYCESDFVIANVAGGAGGQVQRQLLTDKPDVVIGTPAKVLGLLQSKTLSLSSLESLIIDEADLILSYGHDEDIRQIFEGSFLPKVYQSFLMSATMTEDVETLKSLALRNPVTLKLEEDEDEAANLAQYSVRCSEVDKFLLTYVILKLKLVKGKCILFVNDVDRCYRLKLFLEQFSVKSCVLNSELPLNSRYHVVQEFNKGVYDYIVATDESNSKEMDDEDTGEGDAETVRDGEEDEDEEQASENDEGDDEEFVSTQRQPESEAIEPVAGPSKSVTELSKPSKKRRREVDTAAGSRPRRRKVRKVDTEYGVTRGIDFIDVACVLNFDLPTSARSYTHRVGRTARAGRSGMSLSFIVPTDEFGKHKTVGGVPSTAQDEKVWARIEADQAARGSKVREYKFAMKQVEAFRYRMDDALRAVTKSAIREARIKELKQEILNSDKLKAHFEDNPLDLEFLRHDKPLHPTRVQSHMKHVPRYLLPRIASVPAADAPQAGEEVQKPDGKDAGFVPFNKRGKGGRGRGRGRGGRFSGGGRGGKKSDPLKKFR